MKTIQRILLSPVREFPFIAIFIVLMGGDRILQQIHGRIVNMPNPGNYPSFEILFGSLAIWFIVAWTISLFFSFSRVIKTISYIVVLLFFSVQTFLLVNFGAPISAKVLMLMAETNTKETSEFLELFVFSEKIVPLLKELFLYIVLILLVEYIYHKYLYDRINKIFLKRGLYIWLLSILMPLLLFGLYVGRIYVKIPFMSSADSIRMTEKPSDPFSCLYSSFFMINVMSQQMENVVSVTLGSECGNLKKEADDSLNVILVIGESYCKWHSQLYGYRLQTTPHLCEQNEMGRLFVFNNVVSPSNSTSIVVKNLLCSNSISEGEEWSDYPYIPYIIKQSGYNVFFWDNQRDCSGNSDFSFTLNALLYNPSLQNLSYSRTNLKSYDMDGDLIKSFVDSVGVPNDHQNFIVFHLMGQHFEASGRFPHTEKYLRFSADSIKREEAYLDDHKKQRIADYDNATFYNDDVLSSIFTYFGKTNSIVIYLSDHGDEIYDFRDQIARDHGPLTSGKLKYQYEIPFMIWCSDIYKMRHPEIIKEIEKSRNRPFMSDNICHMLFHIANIDTKYYKPERDLLNPNYRIPKRIVEGKVNFDDVIDNKK